MPTSSLLLPIIVVKVGGVIGDDDDNDDGRVITGVGLLLLSDLCDLCDEVEGGDVGLGMSQNACC